MQLSHCSQSNLICFRISRIFKVDQEVLAQVGVVALVVHHSMAQVDQDPVGVVLEAQEDGDLEYQDLVVQTYHQDTNIWRFMFLQVNVD